MDTTESAFEAEVDLDQAALRHERESRRGARAAQLANGGLGTSPGSESQGASEHTPLLSDGGRQTSDEEDDEEEDKDLDEFSHLPWTKRPSVFWVLSPFFFMALGFGGAIAPKMNLILELVCHRYLSEQQMIDPNFVLIPVDFDGGDNDQCRIPEVSARVAQFMIWAQLLPGILSAITSPKLGALSDRYGRKPILMFATVGACCFELITIFAAKYPEKFPVELMLVGYALDGLTGSFILSMAIANAYATDCTPAPQRSVVFGYFHGCLFTGLALGPILAGYIVKWTGQIVVVFYVLLALHLSFAAFIGLFVPESLSKRRRDSAKAKYADLVIEKGAYYEWIGWAGNLNLLEPLKILWPTGEGSSAALRRNLLVLAAVDTIVFGVAMGSMTVVMVYVSYQFGWQAFEMGRFISTVSTSRVFFLIVVFPAVTRLIRGKPSTRNTEATGSDNFDLNVIRVAVLLDTVGYLGYIFARRGEVFLASGVLAAAGGIASPTLQSALTKHVPSDKTGQLLGASGLLHSLARVIAPTIFSGIYSLTVKKFPQAVFVCLAATFGLAFVISWFIRPHVYFDENLAADAARDAEEIPQQERETEHVPIVSAMMAWFGSALVWVGLKSSG